MKLRDAIRGGAAARQHAEPARWIDDLVAGVFVAWMVLGLVIDGWNHINLQDGRLGAFLTPWHGILYAGFTACLLWVMTRGQVRGAWRIERLPRGYEVALAGFGLATIGVVGDAVWHTLFGVEADVARMLAPFHLFLYAGVALVAVSPARSGWRRLSNAPTARDLVPTVISTVATVTVIAFVVQWLSPFMTWFPSSVLRIAQARSLGELVQVIQIGGVMVSTVVLLGPLVVLHRRYALPAGTSTLILVSVVSAIASLSEFDRGGLIVAALAGGVVIDALALVISHRARALRIALPSGAFVMWLVQYAVLAGHYHVTSPIEIWGGAVGLATLTAYLVGILAIAPAAPHLSTAMVAAPATAAALDAPVELAGFVQQFADVVGALERSHEERSAAVAAAAAARALRHALASLPATLRPQIADELAGFEAEVLGPEVSFEDLFGYLADAAAVLTVPRLGLSIDPRVRALLFNLTARAETLVARAPRSVTLVDAPTSQAMAEATLRNLDRYPDVIDLTDSSFTVDEGARA